MLRRWLVSLLGAGEAPGAATSSERIDLTEELGRSGRDAATWIRERLSRPALYSSIPAAALERLREGHRAEAAATVEAAERILRHEFDLLGSGVFVPIDPDRAVSGSYVPIDWYLDPVRGLRFPRGIPYKEWKLYEMRPGNADVKYPWELARCQHWATLGQAFRLSGDERFAREIANELDDFAAANPVGIGINWTCTMDVALRAVNWAVGLELVQASAAINHDFLRRAYSALFDHGQFIRANLENTYEVTSNHFLSNVAGLWFLGAVFADLPQGAAWKAFARTSLEQEMDVQVLQDGADFESSIPYHRLVTELFLGCARLAEFHGEPLSAHYMSRVKDMIGYHRAVTRPDGLMPQVGDADDGRLHVLGGYGRTSPQDGRHVFGAAATMFDEAEWARAGGEAGAWEAAWWGVDGVAPASSGPPAVPVSRLCPDAGVAVMRGGDSHYALITNGIVGTKGFGNHKHNDQLSFEYHHGGIPLVVDPGSYVYTSDAAARNRFRGTAFHNTLQIDGVEQNELNPEWLFRLFESSHAEHVSFDDQPDAVQYVGRHHGYERLPNPVTHERTLRLVKSSGAFEISDRLTGRGDHDLRWHFHFAPGVGTAPVDDVTLQLTARGRRWSLRFPHGLRLSSAPAAYSPSYGVTLPCLAIELATRAALDQARTWAFSITA